MNNLSTEDILIGLLGIGIIVVGIPFTIALFLIGIDSITEAWKLIIQ